MPNYDKNPYLRTGNGRYRQEKQIRYKRRFRLNPVNMSIIGAAAIALAITVFSLAGGGAKPKATATPAPTPAPVVVMPPDASAVLPTASPTPASATSSSQPPAATGSTAPSGSPSAGYFTAGDVQVDYDNMTYKSADLYVKVTNVNENGVNYYVADCRMKDSNRLFTALATDQYPVKKEEYATVMAKRKGAVIAINGDYFASGDSGDSDTLHRNGKGVVIRNGKLYRSKPWYDIAAIYKDGTMKTYEKSGITADGLIADNCWQAWNFGPMLLDGNGKAIAEKRPPYYSKLNPRTGIGYIEQNHFVLVVVDGVRNGINEGLSKGITTADFAKLFEKLGCKRAYNLDGGGSSVMVFMGKVVSHPCDQGTDNQRSMSDIIYFGESETDQANVDRIKNR